MEWEGREKQSNVIRDGVLEVVIPMLLLCFEVFHSR